MIAFLLRILLLALIVLGVIALLRRLAQTRHQDLPSDESEKTDLWTGMSNHFQQLDQELEEAKHWSNDELALAIEQYVFKLQHSDEDTTNLFSRVTRQPQKTAAMVLELLANPDLQTRLRKEPRGQPALYRACQLLMEQPTQAAIPYVRPLLAASGEKVRDAAYYWLGHIADKSVTNDLIAGLENGRPEQLRRMIAGLHTGNHSPGSDVALQLFEHIATLLIKNPEELAETAAKLLLSWHRSKALAKFELAGILQLDHPGFAKTLDLMRSYHEWLARERLLSLWQVVDADASKHREAKAVLQMLACHKHEGDERLLMHVLDRSDSSSSAAAIALLTFYDLDNWVVKVSAKQRDQRSTSEQAALCIWDYASNMQAGGHGRYFFNSGSTDWQLTIDSLRQAGDDQRADVLSSAAKCFSPRPSADREVRQSQIAKLTLAQDQLFAKEDNRYAKIVVAPETIIARFLLANLANFH